MGYLRHQLTMARGEAAETRPRLRSRFEPATAVATLAAEDAPFSGTALPDQPKQSVAIPEVRIPVSDRSDTSPRPIPTRDNAVSTPPMVKPQDSLVTPGTPTPARVLVNDEHVKETTLREVIHHERQVLTEVREDVSTTIIQLASPPVQEVTRQPSNARPDPEPPPAPYQKPAPPHGTPDAHLRPPTRNTSLVAPQRLSLQAASEPNITVNIGVLDIRVTPAQEHQPRPRQQPSIPAPPLSLSDYLAKRGET